MQTDVIYLEALPVLSHVVGYGTLGTGGSLGYENKLVAVRGYSYRRAFSAHPPARLRFQLDGRFRSFRCNVGLNDDVPVGRSHADFIVLADGRQVAAANFVAAGEGQRPLCADITGAQTLELVTQTSRWEYSHAVWLDPHVSETSLEKRSTMLVDCLHRAEITLPEKPLIAERCVATVTSPGVGNLLDDMLGSFYTNSCCQDALPVIFALDADEACVAVATKYQAELVLCSPIGRISAMSKAILYSAALVVQAEQFLCLDTDMLILGDLRPVFAGPGGMSRRSDPGLPRGERLQLT